MFDTVFYGFRRHVREFWAAFCRRSVLHCHYVSLSGRAAFATLAALGSTISSSRATREAAQQPQLQQQRQQLTAGAGQQEGYV